MGNGGVAYERMMMSLMYVVDDDSEEIYNTKLGFIQVSLCKQIEEQHANVNRGFEVCRSCVQMSGAAMDVFFGEHEPRKAVESLVLDEDIAILTRAAASDTTESIKAEYLERYIGLVKVAAAVGVCGKTFKAVDDVDKLLKMLSKLQHHASNFDLFVENVWRDKWCLVEGPSFKPRAEDTHELQMFGVRVNKDALAHLAQSLEADVADGIDGAPPDTLLDNPKLLVSPELQLKLFGNPNREKLTAVVVVMAEKLKLVASCKTGGVTLDKPTKEKYKAVFAAKTTLKRAILMDWAVNKLVNDKKESDTDIADQAKEIKDNAKLAKVILPGYMMTLLNSMSLKRPLS